MAVPVEIVEAFRHRVRSELLPFYMSHGCPCAFPRLRRLLTFFHRDFGTGPVGCYETELLINDLFRQRSACYERDSTRGDAEWPRAYACTICSSRYEEDAEEYSINFSVSFLRAMVEGASPAGADVADRTPLALGLYWLNQSDADACHRHFYQAPLDEFFTHMKAMR